jgi:hypothetical protein
MFNVWRIERERRMSVAPTVYSSRFTFHGEQIMSQHEIKLKVNGTTERATVLSNMTLLTMLREVLVLTGTKNGCAAGECG